MITTRTCHYDASLKLSYIHRLQLFAKQSEFADIGHHRGILSIQVDKSSFLGQQTDLVAIVVADSADNTGSVRGRLDARRPDRVVAVNSRAGKVVIEGHSVAISENRAAGMGTRVVVGNGEAEYWEILASLLGRNGHGGGEESGKGDERVHFGLERFLEYLGKGGEICVEKVFDLIVGR